MLRLVSGWFVERRFTRARSLALAGQVAVDLQDITDNHRLQNELRAQRDRHQGLLDIVSALGQGVVIIRDGRISYANQAYARIVGFTVEELLRLPSARILAADDDVLADYDQRRRQADGVAATAEATITRVRHKDGHAVPVETVGLQVEHDRTTGGEWIFVVRDLTERQKWELTLADRAAQLEEANQELSEARDAAHAASRAKSDFVAMMSHEIRTPLNGVLGLHAMLLDTELSPDQRQLAETAARCGESLLDVINDILDFSKIEAGKVEIEPCDVDLPMLLHDVADLFAVPAAGKHVDLLVDVASDVPATLVTDPSRVRQILNNLVGNAVKFTEAGHIMIRAYVAGPGVLHAEVTDTGPGIHPEDQARLFRPFEQVDASTTRRFGGTGLGLTISRQLAELLGGTLRVSSRPGHGSTFTLVLPAPTAAAPQLVDPQLEGQRILLLCAGQELRRNLREQLSRWGAAVIAPEDASWAMPEPGQIDFAVIDARRPPPGPAEEDRLRRLAARCPALAITTPGQETREGVPAGIQQLHLPPRPERLLAAIQGALRAASRRPPHPSAHTVADQAGSGSSGGQPVPAGREATADTPHARSGLRILIAEDNEVNQKVTAAMVAKLGHSADVVGTGQQAVDAAQGGEYDLILMDCQMPELDGWEATRRLRAVPETRDVPIIALTASASTDIRQACFDAGMTGYLSKPVRLDDIRRTIAESLALLDSEEPQQQAS